MKKGNKDIITVSIDSNILLLLDDFCAKTGISRSQVVNMGLIAFLNNDGDYKIPIKKGVR